jgi:DNA-binding NtrC family response regulator
MSPCTAAQLTGTHQQRGSREHGEDPTVLPEHHPADCVLFVGNPRNYHQAVERALRDMRLDVLGASCYREALSILNENRVSVVYCEQQLRDGGWRDLLGRFADMNDPPALIVLAESTDSASWAEAINLGAHDVLLFPLVEEELQRVTYTACRSAVRYGERRKHASA